jgi:excisionase family DNA binding protein
MSNLVGVKEAAELLGVSTKTIRRWEESGKIRSTRTEGGHRRFNLSDLLGNKSDASLTIAYARVSSANAKRSSLAPQDDEALASHQKSDLERQAMVLEAYCAKQGWSFELIKDLGKRGAVESVPPNKTRITIRIDDDILAWFRALVHERGGGNYQTLINNALRQHIEQKHESLEETLRRVLKEELNQTER